MMLFEPYEPDGITPVYFRTAREHEGVFRGVLTHIKSACNYMPKDFDTEAPIEDLLETCSPWRAYDRFAVGDFLVGPREGSDLMQLVGGVALDQSVILFGNARPLSGSEAIYQYEIKNKTTPVFQKALMEMKS